MPGNSREDRLYRDVELADDLVDLRVLDDEGRREKDVIAPRPVDRAAQRLDGGERGIDVVRDRIKNFARSSFGGYDYRVIFLDEALTVGLIAGVVLILGGIGLVSVPERR